MNLLTRAQGLFIPESVTSDPILFYRYKLLLNASVSTSLFSLLYLGVSLLIDFPKGVSLMVFNVLGFLILPFLMRTKASIVLLGNLFVLIGTLAVLTLIYYSGGITSPIFPWIIAPPVLALLIINRKYSILWTGISLFSLIAFTWLTSTGHIFPTEFDQSWNLFFLFLCSSGIILIVVMIELIFEKTTANALHDLGKSKEELAKKHKEILEKNELLTKQREELLVTSTLLKELNEKKDNLMYIIAHDLKSPLATMQALIQLVNLENKNVDLTERQVLQMISGMADKSQALIQKILNAENFENLAYNLQLEKFDISVLLEEVIKDSHNTAINKGITIQFLKEHEEDASTLVDKVYLSQVYENLINNAIKFSPAGKKVTVSVKVLDKTIRTEIQDEGPGIKPDEISMLFRKFQKLSNQPTGNESSSGLGLSIVKQYIEMLSGKVWCESTLGQGALFIVELPIHN